MRSRCVRGDGRFRRGDGAGHHGRFGPPAQSRVLAQHRLLQLLQGGAGVDAELVGQGAADPARGGQRVRLPAGPGQRENGQGPERLAHGVVGENGLQVAGHRRVLPQAHPQQGQVLDGDHPQLGQTGALGHHRVVGGQIVVRGAPPQRQGRVQVGAHPG